MGDWAKYLGAYRFNEVFLDIKLEELLNIFGRRQCKSCVEFDTGARYEADDRGVRSWPLSPREEAIVGQEGDLVEFQLADNALCAETAAEPTAMFDSMARDFSEFGAQVRNFELDDALARKGGNLAAPRVDDDFDRRAVKGKKKRGRKNKYYRQIDQEDDQEANAISDEDNDALDGVKEEDDEDEDEQEARRKKQEEVRLAAVQLAKEEEARKQREEAAR
jgi:hypothetical protein